MLMMFYKVTKLQERNQAAERRLCSGEHHGQLGEAAHAESTTVTKRKNCRKRHAKWGRNHQYSE